MIVLGVGGELVLARLKTSSSGHPSSGHQYLIFTDQGVFKDTDNFWLWKWDSSDLYGQLLPGHTYRCQVHGVRDKFTSGYPDLITARCSAGADRCGTKRR